MMNIPKHWIITTIGEVCTKPQYGWTSKSTVKGEFAYVRITDIKNNKIDWQTVPFATDLPSDIQSFLIEKNDILIARSGSSAGLSVWVCEIPKKTFFASYLIRFKPIIVNPKYINFFLKSEIFWEAIVENVSGNSIPNINATKLANIAIPLPPLSEQNAIVEKLDLIFTDLEAARKKLAKIPKYLAKFRQAVLQRAISGELTEEWREKNKLEHNNILAEVTKMRLEWIEANRNNNEAIRIEKKIKKHKIEVPKMELPQSWIYSSLLECSKFIIDSINKTPKYSNSGYLVLRTSNIKFGKIVNEDAKYVNENVYKSWIGRVEPQENDIIFTREAPVGEAALFPKNTKACLGQRTMLFRFFNSVIDSRFILYYLLSNSFKQELDKISVGVGVQHLKVGDVEKLIIAIPTFQEQKIIANKVELLFAIADKVQANYETAMDNFNKLEKSILQQAFSGELVTAEPQTESLESLLEKIRIEKEKLEKEKKEWRKKQAKFKKRNFMKASEHAKIKAKIKEEALAYATPELTQDNINEIREKVSDGIQKFDYDDFEVLFRQLAQNKIKKEEEEPFFQAVNIKGKLHYKITKPNETTLS